MCAALQSGCFEEVMVSTDSVRYAATAVQYGASVPFLRSPETATDTASSWSVVLEVLARYGELGKTFTHVCLLQPTSPLRTAEDIREAFRMLHAKQSMAVVSVCPAEHSPLLCGTLPLSGSLDGFLLRKANGPRQVYERAYRLNGAIYLTQCDFLKQDSFLYRQGCYALTMDSSHSIDVDTVEDFVMAEALMQWRRENEEVRL